MADNSLVRTTIFVDKKIFQVYMGAKIIYSSEYPELILDIKHNTYFILDDSVTSLEVFKAKFIAWTCRATFKGVSDKMQKENLRRFNEYLGTNFSKEDMEIIYTKLGNDIRRELCIEFINSNYDLKLLSQEVK